jgi:hypothetical protein
MVTDPFGGKVINIGFKPINVIIVDISGEKIE